MDKDRSASGQASEPIALSNGAGIMPSDYSISLAAKGGADFLLRQFGGERAQSMRGFEATYIDIIDYIARITH